jgi:glycosyltransferase involved in cell wall biosynthesis
MKEWPKISVVVATYNRRQYLKRMLDNLIKDDYPNIEIVVVDGGSSDEQ